MDLKRQLSKQVSVVEEKAGPQEAGALIVEEKAEVGMVSQACCSTHTVKKLHIILCLVVTAKNYYAFVAILGRCDPIALLCSKHCISELPVRVVVCRV